MMEESHLHIAVLGEQYFSNYLQITSQIWWLPSNTTRISLMQLLQSEDQCQLSTSQIWLSLVLTEEKDVVSSILYIVDSYKRLRNLILTLFAMKVIDEVHRLLSFITQQPWQGMKSCRTGKLLQEFYKDAWSQFKGEWECG